MDGHRWLIQNIQYNFWVVKNVAELSGWKIVKIKAKIFKDLAEISKISNDPADPACTQLPWTVWWIINTEVLTRFRCDIYHETSYTYNKTYNKKIQ